MCVIDGSSNSYNLSINIVENDDIFEDNDVVKDATRLDIVGENIISETITYPLNGLAMRVRDDDYFVTNVPAGLAIIVEVNFPSSEDLNLDLFMNKH